MAISKDRDPMTSLDAAFEQAEREYLAILFDYADPKPEESAVSDVISASVLNPIHHSELTGKTIPEERVGGASRKDKTQARIKAGRRARRAILATEPLRPTIPAPRRSLNGRIH